MKISGIIAEYNPFHNGHAYHADVTRQTGATHVVAVMSGNFVQRGEPAIISKFERAKIAAQSGIDLVIELPVWYAMASSERFAYGAVSLLDSLGCVDSLSFGSECGDVLQLKIVAEAAADTRVIGATRDYYEQGQNYPSARQQAITDIYGETHAAILKNPNDLLAVDYIKALRYRQSDMTPQPVLREAVGHDSDEASGRYASASFLRQQIARGHDVSGFVTQATRRGLERLKEAGEISGGLKAIERAVLYKMRSMTVEQMCELPDCSDGLGNRLFNAVATAASIEEIYEKAKTKRYTMSRIRRAVACAVLDISARPFSDPPYARVLAIGKNGEEVLSRITKKAMLPVSHSLKSLRELSGPCRECADAEIRATDVFNLTLNAIKPTLHDYTQKLYTEAVQ